MNTALTSLINRVTDNKHTTIAGAIYAFEQFGIPILEVWFPSLKPKLEATRPTIQHMALIYGLATAGGTGKSSTETKQALNDLQNQVNQVKQDTATFAKPTQPTQGVAEPPKTP